MHSRTTYGYRLSAVVIAVLAAFALLSGCGSDEAVDEQTMLALNAEVCTEGEARDTVLLVRNLDDFDWKSASITVVKGDLEYTQEVASLRPESVQVAQPFTVASDFAFDDLGGSAPSGVTGEQVHERRPLHNFGNLTSARIVSSAPQAGEWSGEVHPCQ